MTDLETVTAAAIFLIVLVVSMKSLGAMLTLSQSGTTMLSICVATLSALSLTRLSDDTFETILLPYAALALAILHSCCWPPSANAWARWRPSSSIRLTKQDAPTIGLVRHQQHPTRVASPTMPRRPTARGNPSEPPPTPVLASGAGAVSGRTIRSPATTTDSKGDLELGTAFSMNHVI